MSDQLKVLADAIVGVDAERARYHFACQWIDIFCTPAAKAPDFDTETAIQLVADLFGKDAAEVRADVLLFARRVPLPPRGSNEGR